MKTVLTSMWKGNPILMMVLLGLPFGFLSLICYGICCPDLLDANDDEDGNFFYFSYEIHFYVKIIYTWPSFIFLSENAGNTYHMKKD